MSKKLIYGRCMRPRNGTESEFGNIDEAYQNIVKRMLFENAIEVVIQLGNLTAHNGNGSYIKQAIL